ncbi:Cyclin, N-terminal [Dillenia turbinata]|uniref:Cyclin, N-terminal n=1 Tax=Dillenia turbinata TaxID=194707 RepID=A0AAN8UHB7_9MAGN
MGGSEKINPGIVGPTNFEGLGVVGGKKFIPGMRQSRQVLGDIDCNIIGPSVHPLTFNQQALQEKDAACEKSSIMLTQKPFTRKDAVEREMKITTSVPSDLYGGGGVEEEDCVVIDMEEFMEASDVPLPMFVKHTEAILDEFDHMVEVEMHDAVDDHILDIDSLDLENPLAVVEYVDDIYAYYRKVEISTCISPNYMAHQFNINEKMRAILIDWLIEVHYKFELMEETLFLTVNLIDRFLESQTVVRKKLQLVGITALLLAAKYEEVVVPAVEDLIHISDKAYTRKDVLDMEKSMVNKLQFNMSVPTPYVFMRRFLKAARCDGRLESLSFFIIELCLVEYKMLRFRPSLLAAAAVYTAQCSLSRSTLWSKTLEWYTEYTKDELLECSKLMVCFHQKAGMGNLTGVHRKYSMSRYGNAAVCEPAAFL